MIERYDLHTHFRNNWGGGSFSLERDPLIPGFYLDCLKQRGIDGVGLVNFGASGKNAYAFELFRDLCLDKEKVFPYSLVKDLSNALVFKDKGGKTLSVIKAQEIPTKLPERHDHILAIGLDRDVLIEEGQGISQTLKKIKSYGAISCPDHPLCFAGIGEQNLINYCEGFDTWEAYNQNFFNKALKSRLGLNPDEDKVRFLEGIIGKRGISVSDSHNSKDVGNGFIEVEKIDFSSKDNFLGSFKQVFNNNDFISGYCKHNSLFSVLSHVFVVYYDGLIRKRFGWCE